MKYTHGFIALTSVLVLSAVFLSVTISMVSRAISGSSVAAALVERDSARHLAEACVERGLYELVRTLDYDGSDSIVMDDGSCDVVTLGEGLSNRELHAEATIGSHTYRIEVILESISPSVLMTSYERVTQF